MNSDEADRDSKALKRGGCLNIVRFFFDRAGDAYRFARAPWRQQAFNGAAHQILNQLLGLLTDQLVLASRQWLVPLD